MQFRSIWSIDRILSGTITPGQSGPGSDDNEGVLHIPQISSITGTSPSHCLVLYPRHSLEGGALTPLQRCSRYILQPQPTGQFCVSVCGNVVWNILVIIFLLIVFVCVCVYIYIYIYIYIYSMYVCVHLCVCMIHVLISFVLNLLINIFTFIWSNV